MNSKKSLIKRLIIISPISALAIGLLAGCSCSGSNSGVRLGTGGSGGTYYAYGTKLEKLDSGIIIKTTAGSEANLRLLEKGFVDAAIVQSDSLDVSNKGIAALTGLYTEAVQLVVRKDSGITGVEGLRGKRVSVGEAESGVVRNAKQILLTAGLTFEDIEVNNLSFNDAVRSLKEGKIDAFFCTAGVPTEAVRQLASTGEASIVDFDEGLRRRLLNLSPGYSECTIPAGTYQGQEQDIHTLGVRAVLVVDPSLDYDTAYNLVKTVFENSQELNSDIVTDGKLTGESAVLSVGVPFHSAAVDYLGKQGVTVAEWSGSKAKGVYGSQDQ
ncbi:MAG: TAXI family TRAP transporter solute-binding subunit [Lachnospiraceae bacterium]|nr:TAXI family TRAP transporter solute-binding subunit [Lachnospiraceae bacterium]